MKKGDILIIAFVLVLSFGVFLFMPKDGDTVVITQNGKEVYRGSIRTNREVIIPEAGVARIEDGKVYMQEADCPDKTCINMGVATPARPVVCIPNGIIISIVGETEIDAVTY